MAPVNRFHISGCKHQPQQYICVTVEYLVTRLVVLKFLITYGVILIWSRHLDNACVDSSVPTNCLGVWLCREHRWILITFHLDNYVGRVTAGFGSLALVCCKDVERLE